jgi:hypothetical protein
LVERAGARAYKLPPRGLRGLRYLAAVPLLIALGGGVAVGFFSASRFARGPLAAWGWATLAFASLGYARMAYSLVSLAAVIWRGRGEVEVYDDGRVRALDRGGWFRVRWGRLKPGTARRLVLIDLAPATQPPAPGSAPTDLWQLSAETDRGRRVWLAIAYPRAVLAALADELARALVLAAPVEPESAAAPAAPVAPAAPLPVDVETPAVPSRDVFDQPLGSRVTLERHPDGVTITVPPIGIWKATGGIVLLGCVFGALGGIGTTLVILAVLQGARFNPALLVPLVFLCIGVGVLLATIHSGRKRVVLAVVGDQLHTFETGPFGSRRRAFARAELSDIACGPSNIKVNNRNLPQLQIVNPDKTHVGLMTGRDETELMWLATVLRQALGMNAT